MNDNSNAEKLISEISQLQAELQRLQAENDSLRKEMDHALFELRETKENADRMVMIRTSELQERNRELSKTNDEIVEMIGNIVEFRDKSSGEHIKRVKTFTNILANEVKDNYPEYDLTAEKVNLITSASALHDVGKIAISDLILNKPGRFTPEEFEIMKTHSQMGCEVLKLAPEAWSAEYIKYSMEICLNHHEKWDGKGYPNGLKGDDIPISAQIVSIADCFDALCSKRVYKDAYGYDEAFNMILNGECGAFSEKLLNCFKNCMDKFRDVVVNQDYSIDKGIVSAYGDNKLMDLKIMLVDDNILSLDINSEILEDEGAVVTTCTNGLEALECFKNEGPFDAIIMDMVMPVMDGSEATRKIREIENDGDRIPIIALTAEGSSDNTENLLSSGADACMAKPLVIAELTRILLSCMKNQRKIIMQRAEDAVRLESTDSLTKTKNIVAYSEMLADIEHEMKNDNNLQFAVVYVDTDGLKFINENYSHLTGDKYITNCAEILKNVFNNSPIYRIGGDEFVVILKGKSYDMKNLLIDELDAAKKKAAGLDSIEEGRVVFSYGISEYDKNADLSADSVVKRASREMI